jgi:hypothetical protein
MGIPTDTRRVMDTAFTWRCNAIADTGADRYRPICAGWTTEPMNGRERLDYLLDGPAFNELPVVPSDPGDWVGQVIQPIRARAIDVWVVLVRAIEDSYRWLAEDLGLVGHDEELPDWLKWSDKYGGTVRPYAEAMDPSAHLSDDLWTWVWFKVGHQIENTVANDGVWEVVTLPSYQQCQQLAPDASGLWLFCVQLKIKSKANGAGAGNAIAAAIMRSLLDARLNPVGRAWAQVLDVTRQAMIQAASDHRQHRADVLRSPEPTTPAKPSRWPILLGIGGAAVAGYLIWRASASHSSGK